MGVDSGGVKSVNGVGKKNFPGVGETLVKLVKTHRKTYFSQINAM